MLTNQQLREALTIFGKQAGLHAKGPKLFLLEDPACANF
jgi:hypothetical protein